MAIKRKKITACEAKQRLKRLGVDVDKRDYFELGSSAVDDVLRVAKAAGYRKRKDAPGSKARMFYQHLGRKKCR